MNYHACGMVEVRRPKLTSKYKPTGGGVRGQTRRHWEEDIDE
jgi:hypothetical protein